MKATKVEKSDKLILPGYPEPVEVASIKDYPNQGYLEFRGLNGEKHTALYNAECLEATPENQAIALLQGRDRDKIVALKGVGEKTADKILDLEKITVESVKEAIGEADFANLVKDNFR